jgi:Secretion system C-terminal sorting domain
MKKIALAPSFFLMLCLSTNISAQVQAIKSDDFVARIGVNTHFSYGGTPYVDNFNTVKTLLGNLGIRYFREGPDPDYPLYVTHVKDVCNTYGMKIQGIFPGNEIATGTGFNPALVEATLDKIKNTIGTQYFLNMEGLNEPDNFNDNNDANWPANARAVQQAIYTEMKSGSGWGGVPVLGPSVAAGDSYALLGDMKAISDKANLHWYASGLQPSHQEFNYFEYSYDQSRTYNYSDSRPMLLTEIGYSNAGGTQNCGENAAAKYIPRTFMYYLYVKGMEKVFTYEFMNEGNSTTDPEKNFGLVRNNLTVKPSYTSLQNTITLLKEPGANFTPGQLNYTLSGNMTNIYQKLFQKSNGKYYLVIWQEAKSYNVATGQDIAVADRAITLNFNGAIASVKTYRPAPSPIGNGLTAINSYTNPTSVNLSVPDQLLIVEITPGTASATGSLTGSVAINTTAVNLSSVGTNDWKHFDNNDHKASGSMINSISDFSSIGGTAGSYSNDLRNMSWTGGTPEPSFTNNKWGWYKGGMGNGFSFTVVAGNGSNTLKVYVGGDGSSGTLRAHLSNSAAADYVNTTAKINGQWDATYTINYNAAQAGQTLTITWKQASPGAGVVNLQAAALIGTASLAATAKLPALNDETENIAGTAIGIYPNPATNYTTVNLGKMLKNEQAYVEVLDLSGKRIYQSGKLSINTLQLNTGKYAKGTYLIKITKGMETINRKLVIQ